MGVAGLQGGDACDMSLALDLRVVQLLCSRICHDLAGPVGAVSNGLELAREMAESMDTEALDLVDLSARKMFERLRFFRVAFGFAQGAIRTQGEARDLVTPAVIGERCTFDWPEADPAGALPVGDQGLKLMLNLSLLAGECLPRGGEVTAAVAAQGDKTAITLTASGQGARLEEDVRRAIDLEATAEEITPKSAPGLLAGVLARHLGGSVSVDLTMTDRAVLAATVSPDG